MAESPDFSVFKTVFFYSILILLLPISAFFVCKVIVFDSIIGTNNTTSNVSAAIVSVIVLHFALGLFIFRAYSDPEKGRIDKKDDKID
ncbi:hypothetical protein RN001_003244 [Aquatica leii]|uniref:Vacuolar ATPase assembly integral membrane protein VMA21 homolog n=1 Tax=Aquatica leii TaxID=1421715 RepID=A0AAN7PIA7_9COLE|nr:hypothetical protein RN001_003244 [Aquatica leii]